MSNKFVYRFFGGAALGALSVLVPISLSDVSLNLFQGAIASVVVIACGLLSGVLGNKFIDALTNVLNSFAD